MAFEAPYHERAVLARRLDEGRQLSIVPDHAQPSKPPQSHISRLRHRDPHGGTGSGGADVEDVLLASTRAGGATINFKTGEPATSGFAVAIAGYSSITSAKEFFSGSPGEEPGRRIFDEWLKQNAALFDHPATHIGIWYDTSHNEIVLDPVEVFPAHERDAAIQAGIDRDQQAIFHLDTMTEIPTGGRGGRSG